MHAWKLAALGAAWMGTVLVTPAQAQTTAPARVSVVGGLQLELGLSAYQESYKEYNTAGQLIMQEKADMVGVYGRATVPLNADWHGRLSAEYAYGQSDYTGSVWGGSYGSLHGWGIDRHRFSAHAEALYAPQAWGGLALSLGLSGRHLVDQLEQIAGGYRRENTGYFATFGVEHRWQLAPGWLLRPAASYQYLLHGRQTAETQGGLRFKQDQGYGYALSLQLQQLRPDGSGLSIRPFWRYLEIKDSQPSRGYYEPKNKTQELGLDVGWRF